MSRKIVSKNIPKKIRAKKKASAKGGKQKVTKSTDVDIDHVLQTLGQHPAVASGRMTQEELDEELERKNKRRIIMDKFIILFAGFLWICYFIYDDPFIWASAMGISGWPMLVVWFLGYGLGFAGTLGFVALVITGTKRAWDDMT